MVCTVIPLDAYIIYSKDCRPVQDVFRNRVTPAKVMYNFFNVAVQYFILDLDLISFLTLLRKNLRHNQE